MALHRNRTEQCHMTVSKRKHSVLGFISYCLLLSALPAALTGCVKKSQGKTMRSESGGNLQAIAWDDGDFLKIQGDFLRTTTKTPSLKPSASCRPWKCQVGRNTQ